ncbi:transposase [Streptomyces sp. NPDC059534]|uniref:transposase n=1 Tax=Streptomyces sp. NPDC059534 TaxID=3346859 RepID=UPI0036BC7FB5
MRAAATVPAASRGYDVGKKVPGRKRHIVVDCLGLLLAAMVTTASVQDRHAAVPLLRAMRDRYRKITLLWADGGYTGALVHTTNTTKKTKHLGHTHHQPPGSNSQDLWISWVVHAARVLSRSTR